MRRLCIVAHGAPLLYGYLIVALGRDREGADPIEIVVDRRRGGAGTPALERRRRSAVDRELEARGYVVLDENGSIVRPQEPPPAKGVAAWREHARRTRERIDAAWRSLPQLPVLARARDCLATARGRSLSMATRARDGIQSRWPARATTAPAAATPEPTRTDTAIGDPGKVPQRRRPLRMMGGALAAVATAALFVASEPPDPADPIAGRGAHASRAVSAVRVAAVDGPRAMPPASPGAPPPADSAPAPAAVTAPPIAPPSLPVEPAAPVLAAAEPEAAPDRTVASREVQRPVSTASDVRAAAGMKPIRPEEPPPPATAPAARPIGPPRVELQSDVAGRAEGRTITYTARLSDARGRPLVNAEVSLLGWLPDGSDLEARLSSTSTPGVYRASVPVGPRTPSNLRILVAHGGKRFEVAPQRRAL